MSRKRPPQSSSETPDALCKPGAADTLQSLQHEHTPTDEYPPLPDDLKDFRLSFLKPPKYFVSLSVPESLYFRLRRYGISKFYEEAVASFDGDLRSLLTASLEFMEARKNRKPMEAVCNLNGRVVKETLQKIESIKDSLDGIRNMSRAKVLAGLVQLKLNTMK
ncbi:MAG TPA: hypothetical protein VJ549_07380 [Geothrix sp.]|nr:hypothetical protein [Geothrix sp.]